MTAAATLAGVAAELDWLAALIGWRLAVHFAAPGDSGPASIPRPEPPPDWPLLELAPGIAPDLDRRLAVVLAIAPHLRPECLDPLLIANTSLDRRFTEFGGLVGVTGGLWPTVATAAFLAAGPTLAHRLAMLALLDPGGDLHRLGLLTSDDEPARRTPFDAPLLLHPAVLGALAGCAGPGGRDDVPARRLETPLEWDDLVLPPAALAGVDEVRTWIQHRDALFAGLPKLGRHMKPGYVALFHGPPGTGKTLAAALLGKATGIPVYRVDLAALVSKWIGETEKNLARVFDAAVLKRWILFFDEADALLGKRGDGRGVQDRYANQEIAYLLQRIEDHPGVVILASNMRSAIDPAFSRRFHATVYFPVPPAPQREKLWRRIFAGMPVGDDVRFAALAGAHEVTGAGIVNVLRHTLLTAVPREDHTIRIDDIREGIRRELHKEGRIG